MDIDKYQEDAHSFATKGGDTMAYAVLGFIEELGELCGKIHFKDSDTSEIVSAMKVLGTAASKQAKHIRKDWDEIEDMKKCEILGWHSDDGFSKELGDCAWMMANVAHHRSIKLQDVLEENIAKLNDRKNRNVIIGSGDNR